MGHFQDSSRDQALWGFAEQGKDMELILCDKEQWKGNGKVLRRAMTFYFKRFTLAVLGKNRLKRGKSENRKTTERPF